MRCGELPIRSRAPQDIRRHVDRLNPRADNPDLDRPFVEDAAYDIEGNRFDLSLGKRDYGGRKAKARWKLNLQFDLSLAIEIAPASAGSPP
jgi:hypothetical protein